MQMHGRVPCVLPAQHFDALNEVAPFDLTFLEHRACACVWLFFGEGLTIADVRQWQFCNLSEAVIDSPIINGQSMDLGASFKHGLRMPVDCARGTPVRVRVLHSQMKKLYDGNSYLLFAANPYRKRTYSGVEVFDCAGFLIACGPKLPLRITIISPSFTPSSQTYTS